MTILETDNRGAGNGYLEGIAMMTGGVMLLPVMDTIARYLATEQAMAPGQVTFYPGQSGEKEGLFRIFGAGWGIHG